MERQASRGIRRISREKAGAKGFMSAFKGPKEERMMMPAYVGIEPPTKQASMQRQPRAGEYNEASTYVYK